MEGEHIDTLVALTKPNIQDSVNELTSRGEAFESDLSYSAGQPTSILASPTRLFIAPSSQSYCALPSMTGLQNPYMFAFDYNARSFLPISDAEHTYMSGYQPDGRSFPTPPHFPAYGYSSISHFIQPIQEDSDLEFSSSRSLQEHIRPNSVHVANPHQSPASLTAMQYPLFNSSGPGPYFPNFTSKCGILENEEEGADRCSTHSHSSRSLTPLIIDEKVREVTDDKQPYMNGRQSAVSDGGDTSISNSTSPAPSAMLSPQTNRLLQSAVGSETESIMALSPGTEHYNETQSKFEGYYRLAAPEKLTVSNLEENENLARYEVKVERISRTTLESNRSMSNKYTALKSCQFRNSSGITQTTFTHSSKNDDNLTGSDTEESISEGNRDEIHGDDDDETESDSSSNLEEDVDDLSHSEEEMETIMHGRRNSHEKAHTEKDTQRVDSPFTRIRPSLLKSYRDSKKYKENLRGKRNRKLEMFAKVLSPQSPCGAQSPKTLDMTSKTAKQDIKIQTSEIESDADESTSSEGESEPKTPASLQSTTTVTSNLCYKKTTDTFFKAPTPKSASVIYNGNSYNSNKEDHTMTNCKKLNKLEAKVNESSTPQYSFKLRETKPLDHTGLQGSVTSRQTTCDNKSPFQIPAKNLPHSSSHMSQNNTSLIASNNALYLYEQDTCQAVSRQTNASNDKPLVSLLRESRLIVNKETTDVSKHGGLSPCVNDWNTEETGGYISIHDARISYITPVSQHLVEDKTNLEELSQFASIPKDRSKELSTALNTTPAICDSNDCYSEVYNKQSWSSTVENVGNQQWTSQKLPHSTGNQLCSKQPTVNETFAQNVTHTYEQGVPASCDPAANNALPVLTSKSLNLTPITTVTYTHKGSEAMQSQARIELPIAELEPGTFAIIIKPFAKGTAQLAKNSSSNLSKLNTSNVAVTNKTTRVTTMKNIDNVEANRILKSLGEEEKSALMKKTKSKESKPSTGRSTVARILPKPRQPMTSGPAYVCSEKDSVVLEKPVMDGPVITQGFYCVDCNKMYPAGCPVHENNYTKITDVPAFSKARSSVPEQLVLRAMYDQDSPDYIGVIAKCLIPCKTLFGPLQGLRTTRDQLENPENTAYVWEIFDEVEPNLVLDCRNEEQANWLMFVKRARCSAEHNVTVYQQGRDILFVTVKAVAPHTELLYWYATDYARMLGVCTKPEEQLSCPCCHRKFSDQQTLNAHAQSSHPNLSRCAHRCPQCDKVFLTAAKLSSHRRVHTTDKRYACEQCGKSFNDRSNLNRHARLHTDQARQFECTVCGKLFTQNVHLVSHMAMHSGARVHTCRFCELSFRRRAELLKHENQVHSLGTAHRCTHEGCSKQFNRLDTLKKHLLTHTDVKCFRCDLCQKSFRQKAHLQTHIDRIHNQNKAATLAASRQEIGVT